MNVWYDEWEIKPGQSIIETIGNAIKRANYLAIVLSPASVRSKWCKKELNQALHRELDTGRDIIIPLIYKKAKAPQFLKDKLHIDFSDNYFPSLIRLVAHVRRIDWMNVTQATQASSAANLSDALATLQQLNAKSVTHFGSDWDTVKSIMIRHGINVEEKFALIDPDTGLLTTAA